MLIAECGRPGTCAGRMGEGIAAADEGLEAVRCACKFGGATGR